MFEEICTEMGTRAVKELEFKHENINIEPSSSFFLTFSWKPSLEALAALAGSVGHSCRDLLVPKTNKTGNTLEACIEIRTRSVTKLEFEHGWKDEPSKFLFFSGIYVETVLITRALAGLTP